MSKNWYPVINYENCIECGHALTSAHMGFTRKKVNGL
jgi:hypothetical protein